MSQYLRGRGLPILAASAAAAGLYWSGNQPNRDPAITRVSEALETVGRQGGTAGKINLDDKIPHSEREKEHRVGTLNNPTDTKISSHTTDVASKRSATKTGRD